ncbi:ATP-binding protein, partial [Fusobacterium mortiferum]|uniref:ATP-binding protein n=2 Tax=Fusobacterium TaxID=848 RepID=UPI001959FEE5|nr:GHKL domain-containing protein [Fusobacterium mortiferum]
FIQVQIFQNRNSFSIAITDNGKPISDDILSKIFDYGFSTKGQNRGVGLYLVQEKLKLYKGNIRIEREKSKKTFIVEVKNEECINC